MDTPFQREVLSCAANLAHYRDLLVHTTDPALRSVIEEVISATETHLADLRQATREAKHH